MIPSFLSIPLFLKIISDSWRRAKQNKLEYFCLNKLISLIGYVLETTNVSIYIQVWNIGPWQVSRAKNLNSTEVTLQGIKR